MPLLHALGKLADFVVRTIWVILRAIAGSIVGVKRLLAAMHRLRSRGSDGSLSTARLFDVYGATLAADVALLAAWWFTPVEADPTVGTVTTAGSALLATGAVHVVHRVPGIGRAVIGFGLVLRGMLTIVAAQWLTGGALLFVLSALVAPQWGVHLVALARSRPAGRRFATLRLATAYALLGCVIVVVPALVLGWLHPAGPLWLAAVLLTLAALLALRVPADGPAGVSASAGLQPGHESATTATDEISTTQRPAAERTAAEKVASDPEPGRAAAASPSQQAVPQQPAADVAPDGFGVYRPSTLDDA